MKNIEHLRADLYKHTGRAKQIIYQAQAEGRQPNEEELKAIDEANGAARRLEQEITSEERKQEEESRNAVPVDGSPFSYPQQTQTNKGTGPEYRSVFGLPQVLDNAGFRSFGEYLQSIESGRMDSRLQKLDTRNQMNVDTGAEGGFSVPVEYAGWLLDGSLEEEIMRPRANTFPMQAMQRKVPSWDNLDRSSGVYGGINAEWTPELTQRADQVPALREITLEASKLILYVSASREVVQDGAELEQELTKALRKALSHEMDKSFLVGDGNGKPQGIINSPALISVSRENGSQVEYQDLVNMYSQLIKGGRAIWVASHSVLPELMTMETSGNNLIWQPNARDGSPGQLLGMPVLLSDHSPVLGDKGDLMLIDPSRYLVGMRQEIVLDVNQGPGWYKDYTSWRCVLRVAGQGAWDKPMTLSDGTTQLSPFVALDV